MGLLRFWLVIWYDWQVIVRGQLGGSCLEGEDYIEGCLVPFRLGWGVQLFLCYYEPAFLWSVLEFGRI